MPSCVESDACPFQPRPQTRSVMTRDGPGRGSAPKPGSSGGQHSARAAASLSGRPGTSRKPAKGQRSGSLQQQPAPVYGAVPPPPSLHSDGLPSPGTGPLGSGVPRSGPYARQRASLQVDGPRLQSAPGVSGSPAVGGAQSRAKPGIGSARTPGGVSDQQRQAAGQAPASRVFVQSSSSTGWGGGSANAAKWAGSGGSGVFGQGACRMAYEADKEPDVWKV